MFNLPLDVIHSILSQFSDFRSLYAILSSSKLFITVYKKSPASIMRSVAENIVGGPNPLPPVLRLARWAIFADENSNKLFPWNQLVKSNELPLEIHPPFDYVLTWKEAKHLQRFAKYATLYEGQFSRRWFATYFISLLLLKERHRFKDRQMPTSVLTSEESERFNAAFYRLWLYWSLPAQIDGGETDDEDPSEGFLTDNEEQADDDDDGEEHVDENAINEDGLDANIVVGQEENDDQTPVKNLSCTQVLEGLTQSDILDIFFVQSFMEIFGADVIKRNERKNWRGGFSRGQ